MARQTRDSALDTLLDLHKQTFVIEEKYGYWVKFIVQEVPVTKEKPHGIDYSLTLHSPDGERILGFDNAHPIKSADVNDHKHTLKTVKSYKYTDAVTLIADFWQAVEKILYERGVSL